MAQFPGEHSGSLALPEQFSQVPDQVLTQPARAGNPSAGGAYQPALLPPFWRAISSALPNGAATDTVRRIVYFGAYDIGGHLIVLASYAVAGIVIIIIGSIIQEHRTTTGQPGRGQPPRTAAFTPAQG